MPYVGIEVVFIAPAKPWMNGTIEEFNTEFDRLLWNREVFSNLSDIQSKAKAFYNSQNEFNSWKEKKNPAPSLSPKRTLPEDFKIDLNNIPLVDGSIHFIRMVDSNGDIFILNEHFHIWREYIGEYVWATIDTGQQSLVIRYNDEKMIVRNIKQFEYKFSQQVYDVLNFALYTMLWTFPIKEAHNIVASDVVLSSCTDPRYSYAIFESIYGDVNQRWVLFNSIEQQKQSIQTQKKNRIKPG